MGWPTNDPEGWDKVVQEGVTAFLLERIPELRDLDLKGIEPMECFEILGYFVGEMLDYLYVGKPPWSWEEEWRDKLWSKIMSLAHDYISSSEADYLSQ